MQTALDIKERQVREILLKILTKLEDLYTRTGRLSLYDTKEFNEIRRIIEKL